MPIEDEEILKKILKVVRDADERICELPREEAIRKVGKNRFGDDTILADKVSEDTIIKGLREEFDGFRVITEESPTKVYGESPEITFIIDPLDGSKNFLRGIGLSCISVAVAYGKGDLKLSDIRVGVVKRLGSEDVFYSIKGKGAWYNGKPAKTSGKKRLSEAMIDMDLIGFKDEKMRESCLNLLKFVKDYRRLGANALALSFVSNGSLDCAIDLRKRLRVVDYAAAQLIVREAGGKIFDKNIHLLGGDRISYVAASTKELLDEILNLISIDS
ncbi:MAG: inositol monophosphatase family protein [Candidatus Asgardarchaeia archaeon]